MPDHPRTDQEQWAADLLRFLGFDVKMNYLPKGLAQQMEIDVWGRLGPLQVAVECKKYGRAGVGTPDIEYFHKKLEMLSGTLGIFVANSYSEHDLALCRNFGILPLTSETVRDEFARLGRVQSGKKHLGIAADTGELLASVMRFAQDWEGYLNPNWPFHERIYATPSFERHGLIETHGEFGDFQYRHTAEGEAFFSRIKSWLDILQTEGVTPMVDVEKAARLVIAICGSDQKPSPHQGYNRLVVQGLGLQDMHEEPTTFGRLLASVLTDAVPHSNASD